MHIQMTEWLQSSKGIPTYTYHNIYDKEKNEKRKRTTARDWR